MKSTVVEPPPDFDDGDEDDVDFIRASSVQDLANQTNIGNEEVLDRVLLPGKRFGAYEILGFVAAGGMGEIYAARRIKSDGTKSRPVALKVITAEYANDWRIIERFKREARISKAIRSRHVARVYEFGESPQGHVFLAMELLNGEELFDKLHRQGMLSPMEVAEVTLQILKGLHQIHESGFVHRDIKPENIFLAKPSKDATEDKVKIIDFGIAKRAEDKSDPLLSVAGQIYGTPQYIAPEQAINPDVDHRADLYSLGILMYECVTGNLPFMGESSYDTIVAHQNKDVPPLPSSVDPEFAHIIFQSLAKTPDERFQSALEMGRLLKKWRDETSWVEQTEPDLGMDLELDSIVVDDETTETIMDSGAEAFSDSANDGAKNQQPVTPRSAAVTEIDPTPEVTPRKPQTPPPTAASKTAEEPKTVDAPKSTATASKPLSTSQQPDTSQPDNSQAASSNPHQDVTTDLRNPANRTGPQQVSESEARNAQVITGVALGILILAVLWAVFL